MLVIEWRQELPPCTAADGSGPESITQMGDFCVGFVLSGDTQIGALWEMVTPLLGDFGSAATREYM
jgi:hypothetical protein